jgi:hypothetical protein
MAQRDASDVATFQKNLLTLIHTKAERPLHSKQTILFARIKPVLYKAMAVILLTLSIVGCIGLIILGLYGIALTMLAILAMSPTVYAGLFGIALLAAACTISAGTFAIYGMVQFFKPHYFCPTDGVATQYEKENFMHLFYRDFDTQLDKEALATKNIIPDAQPEPTLSTTNTHTSETHSFCKKETAPDGADVVDISAQETSHPSSRVDVLENNMRGAMSSHTGFFEKTVVTAEHLASLQNQISSHMTSILTHKKKLAPLTHDYEDYLQRLTAWSRQFENNQHLAQHATTTAYRDKRVVTHRCLCGMPSSCAICIRCHRPTIREEKTQRETYLVPNKAAREQAHQTCLLLAQQKPVEIPLPSAYSLKMDLDRCNAQLLDLKTSLPLTKRMEDFLHLKQKSCSIMQEIEKIHLGIESLVSCSSVEAVGLAL